MKTIRNLGISHRLASCSSRIISDPVTADFINVNPYLTGETMTEASFDDFKTLLTRNQWVNDHQTGSHSIWYSPKRFRLSIQNRNGMAKGYQVKQFLAQFDEENGNA